MIETLIPVGVAKMATGFSVLIRLGAVTTRLHKRIDELDTKC